MFHKHCSLGGDSTWCLECALYDGKLNKYLNNFGWLFRWSFPFLIDIRCDFVPGCVFVELLCTIRICSKCLTIRSTTMWKFHRRRGLWLGRELVVVDIVMANPQWVVKRGDAHQANGKLWYYSIMTWQLTVILPPHTIAV